MLMLYFFLSLCTIPEDLSVSETGLHLKHIVSQVSWFHYCRSAIIISTMGLHCFCICCSETSDSRNQMLCIKMEPALLLRGDIMV